MYSGTMGKNSVNLSIIQNKIALSKFRIEESQKAKALIEDATEKIKTSRMTITYISDVVHYLKNIKKDIVNYNAERKERSMSGIYSAIHSAKSILPDTQEVRLKVARESAVLVDQDGVSIDLLEGSAFRAILSFFIRRIILTNTVYLPFMLLDEPLSTLSPDTSAITSKYLPVIAQNILVILIEQKDEIFSDIEGIVYEFHKSEGRTTIRCVNS